MGRAQSVIRNTGLLVISNVFSRAINFLYIMSISRYLGAYGFGVLSFAIAFSWIFSGISDFGLGAFTIREVARDKQLVGKYLNNVIVFKIVSATVMFIALVMIARFLGYSGQEAKVIYIISLSMFINSFNQTFESVFRAFENMKYIAVGQALSSILILAGGLFTIQANFDILGLAGFYLLTNLIVLAYSICICVYNFVIPRLEIDLYLWKTSAKKVAPFFWAAALQLVIIKTDVMMLSILKGNTVVGWYAAAYKIIDIMVVLPVIFTSAVYPVFSDLYLSSKSSLNSVYQKSLKFLLIIAFPIVIGSTLLAGRLILTIFGNDFAESVIVLRVLVWAALFIYPDYLLGSMLAAIDKQGLAVKITILCMLSNIMMNLLLIPKFSYVGATVACVISYFISASVSYYYISRSLDYKINIYNLAKKPLMASLLMGIFTFVFAKINLFLLIFSSAAVYFLFVYIFKVASEDEINSFKQVVATKWFARN